MASKPSPLADVQLSLRGQSFLEHWIKSGESELVLWAFEGKGFLEELGLYRFRVLVVSRRKKRFEQKGSHNEHNQGV